MSLQHLSEGWLKAEQTLEKFVIYKHNGFSRSLVRAVAWITNGREFDSHLTPVVF